MAKKVQNSSLSFARNIILVENMQLRSSPLLEAATRWQIFCRKNRKTTFMKYLFLIILWSSQIFAQNVINYEGEKINELVNNDTKNGLWKIVDNERGIIINCEMLNDTLSSSIEYYRYGKLIASQNKNGNLIFYKNNERIYAKLIRENKTSHIVKENGEELDSETSKLFFQSSEVKPIFYGGNEALRYALLNNIDKAKTKNHYGKVIVKFVINNDGIIESAEVAESDDVFLNEEAIRIVKSLPRWQPGFQHGNFIKCIFTIPMNFGTKPK